MRRRTLDTIFAVGGIAIAVLLFTLGFALSSQHAFATNYVKEELSAQSIVFATADKLTDAEKNWKPGSACLTQYAGQLMTTGDQAQCYAKYYIREPMAYSAVAAGFPGATYATLGPIRTDLTAQITAAKAKGDTAAAADLQKKLDGATALRSTMQTGEGLAGMLLTVYGFEIIADRAELAANVLYLLAGLMVVLSAAGFVHAWVTPKDKVVLVPGTVRAPVGA